MLVRNIRALLSARGIDAKALAIWCGHKPAWISKVLSEDRGVQLKELGKISDFFGLTVAQLFQHGIDPLLERRKDERRSQDRRSGEDRRRPQATISGWIHPADEPHFRRSRGLPPKR